MPRPALFAVLCLYCLLLALPARAALDDQQRALQQLQVQACRAVGSLLLLRGEGFQEQHAAQLEKDLASLDRALAAAPEGVLLRQDEKTLVARIREGAAYGPREEDLPWRYPQQLSRALRDFLNLVERQVPPPPPGQPLPLWQLPVRVEYLSLQYLARAYLGGLETAREQPRDYLGQDESVLVPLIDRRIALLVAQSANPAGLKKLENRWEYLSQALRDLNSKSSALVSASGRPWAPIIVDRHARALSESLMRLSAE
ncbi:hypothetical protein QK360_11585 [Pseudomonas aeruginosa]|uniref:hypothetical protein n=1 Tax=Pseudomonas aeruginosa TaxID=287 RepID=UPI00053E6506|nr:hypothetical protein [Pseudomonas aeruginosa]EIU3793024.1 hypothetical protein [Pseudomonas aeruginosa]EKV0490331.1 hypothetical protein [Pseudomonas aeruginosa]MCQ9779849.1 hypothetical protein [Pseudomonas aeruginosa]MCQ9833879.1 hypothetical protein [Pseudomonas aeruginosa]MCQ9848591.1 hypothetical protein [Pseudomonas aeruginosa]